MKDPSQPQWAGAPFARNYVVRVGILVGLALPASLAACSSSSSDVPRPSVALRPSPSPVASIAASPRRASSFGGYKIGPPYRVGSTWYVPHEDPTYDRVGTGSWYGADFNGRPTANGETYNMEALTAAHTTLPLPSYVWVTNQSNGRTLLVRVNDRGPYVDGRIIDLSRAAAHALGYEGQGTAQLRVRYAGRAPLNGDTAREREFLASQPWSQNLISQADPPHTTPFTRSEVWSAPWSLGRWGEGW